MKIIPRATAVPILIVLVAIGCRGQSRPDPPPDGPSPFPSIGIAPSNYPLVDGSTSTQPLGIFIACRILDAGYQWALWETEDSLRLSASEWFLFADPEYDGSKRELCDWINATVRHRGTHSAYDERQLLAAGRWSSHQLPGRATAVRSVQGDRVRVC